MPFGVKGAVPRSANHRFGRASVRGPRIAVFPSGDAWMAARRAAGMETGNHEDMHAGEAETSILLHVTPEAVRPGNETADWIQDERPQLLTLGMRAYTTNGVIGRPSLGTAAKGAAALASLTKSFVGTMRTLTEDRDESR
jgi:creatinine amidohydrolase